MATTDKELEDQLLEAGNKLADPPSSVEDLLSLLDQVESFLSKVEQSPSNSMQIALSPSLKALIADKLLRHSDDDVKVAVASCISEITRITAPDAPYDDDQMKEVFQLIVSSFENLHDTLSRSYAKRTSILETVAKVRSCVVMLDLECDALILEMFQHFFKAIREYHPENVFSSMETIMTLVLEESEDISLDLLSTLLARVKKDDKEAFPIAKKLGERVLESCATKLKPYLGQAVKSSGIPMGDYSLVLSSICQDASDALEKNYTCVTSEHTEDKSELAKRPREESAHVVEKDPREVSSPSQQENPDVNISPKSVMSNGVACVEEGTALTNSKSIKKQEDAECSNHSEGLNISGHEVCNDLDSEKVDNSKSKPEQSTKRRRKKSSSSTKSAKLSKGQVAANDKETEKKLENNSKKVPSSPHEDHFVEAEAAGPSENDKEVDAKTLSPKVYNNESEVASPLGENRHDESRSKKLGRTKRKDGPVKDVAGEDVSKVSGGGASDSEAKPTRRSMKKALGQNSLRKTSVVDSVKKGSGAATDADAKKHSAKKLDENKKGSGGSSSKQIGDKKKGGRTKANPETDLAKSTATDVDREVVSSPRPGTKSTKDESSEETPKANVKRKRSSGKENESDVKDYGENLVGLRVKVWWPEDREFYKGVIHSFYSGKKKHKVLYDDGDEETLNLVKEKWKLIEAGSDADEEGQSDHESLDASTDMPPKKKGKTSAGESTKQGKVDGSSKSGGAAASSRSKGVSVKSSQKSKDGNKSKESKTISKSEDRVSRKSKEGTPKSGSSKIVAAAVKKMSNKSKSSDTSKANESKDDDTSKPKSAAKSKQETPKGGKSKQETLKSAISKGKPLKGGGKSDANGSGKVKSGLMKRKYAEDENSDA